MRHVSSLAQPLDQTHLQPRAPSQHQSPLIACNFTHTPFLPCSSFSCRHQWPADRTRGSPTPSHHQVERLEVLSTLTHLACLPGSRKSLLGCYPSASRSCRGCSYTRKTCLEPREGYSSLTFSSSSWCIQLALLLSSLALDTWLLSRPYKGPWDRWSKGWLWEAKREDRKGEKKNTRESKKNAEKKKRKLVVLSVRER